MNRLGSQSESSVTSPESSLRHTRELSAPGGPFSALGSSRFALANLNTLGSSGLLLTSAHTLTTDDDLVEEEEDLIETNYCNGNNEVVKIFKQKCVICYERDIVYAFRQCYQNKGDNDIIKCVLCRT